tara:strand:+ start:384 stop:902 length:519 start_codon:yes stop_codon:yes gene_type:complete
MSCPLTTGFVLDCKDSIGGVKSVSFASVTDYEALTPVVLAGAITSITATPTFRKYEQLKETSSMTETINASMQNGTVYYTPEVVVVLSKLNATKRNEIMVLAQNRLVALVETNDEVPAYWLVGVTSGLEVSGGTSATGTAYADLQGYNITLGGMEPISMVSISAVDAASITF